ncbi:MAG: HAD-IIA family hydrolase [Polyangiaceae bacterium]|nr:HAD-IIA family hydrolase [Polyangiaceae bacterium]
MQPTLLAAELLERYDVFLLDAYGVLVSTNSALPGAAEFLQAIALAGKKFLVVTNDASRSAATIAKRQQGFGLAVEASQIVTSGSLLSGYFERYQLQGAPTIVLGTGESCDYVRQAGGRVVEATTEEAEVLAVCDDAGYDLRLAIDDVITVLFRRLDRGQSMRLVLPNPDLMYLRGENAYGITSGSVALVIEAALKLRYPRHTLAFERLGKPHRPMYEAALKLSGETELRRVVMVGDQLPTDIRGAVDFGLDSVLIGTGLTKLDELDSSEVQPMYTMRDLALSP